MHQGGHKQLDKQPGIKKIYDLKKLYVVKLEIYDIEN